MSRGLLRHGRERGAVSLEQVGLAVIAAMLVGALVLVLTQRTPVAESARQAVCTILNLGQGSCGSSSSQATRPEPTEPCTVSDSRVTADHKIAVVVVTLRDGREFQIERLSDGTSRVTTSDHSGAGLEAGVGGGLSVTVADRTVGGSVGASAGGELTIKDGDVYHVKDDAELQSLLDAYTADIIKDELVGDAGPQRWLTDLVTDSTGLTTPMPEADETFVEGGFSVNASAQAVALTDSAGAGVGAAEALGYKEGADGSRTYYLSTEVEGEAGLQTLGVDTSGVRFEGADLSGSMQMVTAVTVDPDGQVSSVDLSVSAAGTSSGLASAMFTGDPASSDLSDSTGRAIVYQASLPMDSTPNQVAGWSFLAAQGVTSLGGVTSAVALPATLAAGDHYLDRVRQDGTLTTQGYAYDESTAFAIDASVKVEIEAGVASSVSSQQMDLTDAQYWNGSEMAEWTGCTGASASGGNG